MKQQIEQLIDPPSPTGLIGNLIKDRRIELKMSAQSLGLAVGLTRASISNIEMGRQVITIDRLFLFCEALRIDILDLLQPLSGQSSRLKRVEEAIDRIYDAWYERFGETI